MRPGGEDAGHILGGERGAYGHAIGQSLGHRHDVGRHSRVLICPELARTPHARLDLVEDEQDARLVAELAQPGQIAVVGHVDPALALDGLDQHGRGPAVDRALESLEVIEIDVLEAAGQRFEAVMVLLLRGGGDGGEGPAVEAPPHADDVAAIARPVLLGPFPGELDGRLVRFGARVREEDAVGEGMLAEELGQLRLLRDVKQVGHVEEGRRLLAQGAHDLGVAVAERGHRDPAGKVQVLLAVRVPDPRPLPSHEGDRVPLGEGHEVLVRQLEHPLRVHSLSPPSVTTLL